MNVTASITTTGRRIGKIVPTIQSVLSGERKPDRLVLWLNEEGTPVAPPVSRDAVPRELASMPVDVRWCRNWGPATKLLPSMITFPEDHVVTFDDDVLYPHWWLRRLIEAAEPVPDTILCYRARLIKWSEAGSVRSYREWPLIKAREFGPSDELLPTGIHGVLYPPGSLKEQAFDLDALRKVALPNDDLWFAATRKKAPMLIARGGKFRGRRIRGPRLCRANCRWRNDRIIQNLHGYFGAAVPWHKKEQ